MTDKNLDEIEIGRIVTQKYSLSHPEFNDGEGILLKYTDKSKDEMQILWYKHMTLSLRWSPDSICFKDPQVISDKISPDFQEFIKILQGLIWNGFIK